MQLLSRYLLHNRITIILNETGHVTEYMPVYNRPLEIYKGIDNTIQFYLLNADQKPVDCSDKRVRFVAYDENDFPFLELNATPVKLDDSTIRKGLFEVFIPNNDLLMVDPQYIRYWISIVDFDNRETLTFNDTHFNNPGLGKISQSLKPQPTPVKKLEFIKKPNTDGCWYTNHISLDPHLNSNSALHTCVFYPNGYKGKLAIEVTLENSISDVNTIWSQVGDIIEFDGDETQPIPVNIYGVYHFIRFKVNHNPLNTFKQILIRT